MVAGTCNESQRSSLTQSAHFVRQALTAYRRRRAELLSQPPRLSGSFISRGLPKGSAVRECLACRKTASWDLHQKRQSGELAARPFFAQRLKTQPCPLWELNDLGSGPAYALRSNVSGALICFRSANKQPAVAIGPGTGPIWEWMMLPMHWRSAAAFSRQLQATSAGQTPVGRSLPRRLKLSGL
jgi:hypothetical protein